MNVKRFVHVCALVWPTAVDVSADYRRACRLLAVSVPPAALLAASYTVATSCWLLGAAVVTVAKTSIGTTFGSTLGLLGLGVAAGGRYGLPFAAQARRIRALGAVPSLVTAIVSGTTLWPNCERATSFAVNTGDGMLAEQLGMYARRARGTPQSGLETFATRWGEQFPALQRAVTQIERASAAPPDNRAAILDSARRCILDGARDEMATFATSLRAPATGLYAFGVLLPLALVSLLPAVAASGIQVTGTLLIIIYGVALPMGLVVASCWLLGQRPVAFPATPVPRSHPAVPSTPWLAVGAGLGAGVGGWLLATVLVPNWGPPLAALGAGVGTALSVHYRPMTDVRDHVTSVESSLPDAMTAVGRRVSRGQSVEAALADAAEEVSDPLATVLDATVEQQQRLGTDVETAFCGEYGTLRTIPSPRMHRVATLLGAVAEIGPPAGQTLVTMGDHLEALRDVEHSMRRDLAQVTGTLSNTSALFGPLVGGATVALAGKIGEGTPLASASSAPLGLVVGWYVLVLAVTLTALSTGLSRGLDRALVGYRVGLALLSATATFLSAVVAASVLI